MTALWWIERIFLGALGYFAAGSVVTLFIAYVSALRGGHWFNSTVAKAHTEDTRWLLHANAITSPAIVLVLWPLALILGGVAFLVDGWASLMEHIGDRVIQAGTMREKQLRGKHETGGTPWNVKKSS